MNDFNQTNLKAFMLNANEFIFANQDGQSEKKFSSINNYLVLPVEILTVYGTVLIKQTR